MNNEKLLSDINRHAKAITSDAANGDPNAQGIINMHRMYCRCPSDPGSIGIMSSYYDDWYKESFVT